MCLSTEGGLQKQTDKKGNKKDTIYLPNRHTIIHIYTYNIFK